MNAELRQCIDEFVAAWHRGEALPVDDYCARHPEFAKDLTRELADFLFVAEGLESIAGDGGRRPLREVPERIGPYRILEEIGSGGMGVVFLAEQREPVRRRVALKLIRPGLDSRAALARFETERQALALMDHPGIARVLDAGATDLGRPWFVMDYVQGEPLTRYCDMHAMDVPERLRLFVRVCHAVQHAHQKGIVHRDLKPSNILVRCDAKEHAPTIIDFGLAKAMGPGLTDQTVYTHSGQLVGTYEYMSPEQASLGNADVDTRTDIYSLGVILYELLAGEPPIDKSQLRSAGLDEIRTLIREREPSRPSVRVATAARRPTTPHPRQALPRLLRGDLDWITLKAIAKDRTRRYATVSELAADLERHLRHETVEAGRPSIGYRVLKFARRNRVAVISAALITIALLAGLVVARVSYSEAERARERSEYVFGIFQNVLRLADPRESGTNELTVREVLERTARELEARPIATDLRAEIHLQIGRSYRGLGRHAKADSHVKRALALRRQLNSDPLRTAECMWELARYTDEPDYDGAVEPAEAVALVDAALRVFQRELGDQHEKVGLVTGTQARLAAIVAAGPLLPDAIVDWYVRETGIEGSPEELRARLTTDYDEVRELWQRGQRAAAHALIRRWIQPFLEKPLYRAFVYQGVRHHARALERRRDFVGAEATYETCLAIELETKGAKSATTIAERVHVADFYRRRNRQESAVEHYEAALRDGRETLGPTHPLIFGAGERLARIYATLGELDTLERLLRKRLRDCEDGLGAGHRRTQQARKSLRRFLDDQGRDR